MMRACHQVTEHLVTVGGRVEAQHPVSPTQRLPQVLRTGGHDFQRRTLADPRPLKPQVKALLTRSQTLSRCGFEHLQLDLVVSRAEPRCSIWRDPRREDHTICTAVAPEAVFTVRTYATTAH
jgi:hypothetical protein